MDSSIYGSLAAMSQPWTMRYPLVSWHGNNGSRDGDEPAAYRYTECKLSKIGEEMLADIKKDTVDWQSAYTDEEQEPVYLPGKIPNLIVNGTSGIAWAMACSFAPHNLVETMDAAEYLLDHEDCTVADLLQFIQGPDFPTGGLLINKDELLSAYSTGKGRARIRGEYTIESSKNGDTIVFTSVPFKVSKEKLIMDIDELCEKGIITGIKTIRDESNQEGVRFVIELEKDTNTISIITKLFKNTQLEETFSINQVALVDKKPVLLNLKELLENYILHQKDVLLRKTRFEADKVSARIHILDGILIALANIDDVITLIKNSESAAVAKNILITKYNLSETQAKAILDIKLSRLAKLEALEVENEKNELVTEFNRLIFILKHPISELHNIFKDIKQRYGDARRTFITQAPVTKEEKEVEFVEPEKCVVVMTEDGLIKRIPSSSFRTQKRNGKGVKMPGDIISAVIRTNTVDSLMVFSDHGRMYRILVNDIPVGTNTSKGQSIKSLINMEPAEKPTLIYSIYKDTDAKYVLFVTKNGLIKKTALSEYIETKRKTGVAAINLREGDSLVSVNLIKDEPIILITKNGIGLHISSTGVNASGRVTMGIKGINLTDGDSIVAVLPIRDITDKMLIVSEMGLGKRVELAALPLQTRGGKGLIVYKPTGTTGNVVSATLVSETDSILLMGSTSGICINAADVPVSSRSTIGNQLIKGTKITSISKV